MKKRLLPVALLLGTFATNAQVGIGTATPNKSAELLIESSNRGLLIPNVALTSATDRTTITNGNVQSLMVYATKISEKKDITPGYYYWDINKWVRLTADKDIPQIVVNNFQEIVNKDGDKVQNIIKNIVKNTEGNVIYEGDKFYTFTKDGDKVVKQEIKDKLTSIVYDEVTGDYIYYNENAVDRNGKIIGEGIRIKVKETVINKFGDIINNNTVQEHITNYLDGTHVGGNVYYDGDKLTYVTKGGETKEVSINQVITANESKTAIISVNKKQYYVSEEYLVANKGVVPTTVDAANLPKGIYAIDVVGGVVNNLEEIVNNGPVTVDGRTFKTVNDYITYLTESKGGFTKIVYDQSTGDVIFQEWDETTQKYVNVDNSKFNTIVKGNETLTTLIDKGDGTLEYTDEKGKTVSFDSNKTTVETQNGVYTFKDGKGGVITAIDTNAKAIGYDNTDSGLSSKDVQSAIDEIVKSLGSGADVSIKDNNNGSFSVVSKDGTVLGTVNKAGLIDNTNGTYTFTNGNGKDVTIDVPQSVINQFDKIINGGPITVNGNTYTTVEEYLKDFVEKNETVTTLKNNNNGTYTYTSENGTETIIDIPSSVVKQFETIVKQPVTVDGRTFTNVDEYIKYVTETKGGFTKIVYNKEGDVVFQEWNETKKEWVNVDNSKFSTIVKENETVTTLVKNVDGTYTYYNEKQIGADGLPLTGETGVTIDPKEVSVALNTTKNVYEFKNSKGDVVGEIDANAGGIVYNDNSTQLGATNVQGAIEKLLEKITTVEGTSGDLVVSGGLEFIAKTTGVKALLADANIQVANKGISTEKLDDKAVTNEKLGEKSVSADKMTSFTSENGTTNPVAEGQIPVADGKGGVAYKEISGETLKGKALTSGSISVFGGEKALLDGTVIEVLGGEKDGQVLITKTKEIVVGKNADGTDKKETHKVTEWVDPKEFVSGTVNAKNGITVVNNATDGSSEFKLGGYLTEATVIDTKENTLAIANMDLVEKGKVLENNLVIADANGVLKQTSAKNLIEDVITDGKLEAKDLTSQSIIVKGGENSLLKDTNLEIKGGTSEGQVLVSTPELDANGQPVVDENGKGVYITKWVNADKVGVEVTNGIQKITGDDGTIKLGLGGTLTEPKTSITTTDKNVLAIEGLANIDKPVTAGNNLVIADANGVLKQTSAKNLIEDAVEAGNLEAKALTTDGVIVIGTDSTSTTVLADNSLLADVKLNIGKDKITADHIATGAVTSDEILDGTIKPEDMESAGKSKVLVTGADGQVQWIDQSTLNNKDTFTGNAPISIVEGSTNTTGGKDYVIQIADANGTTAGVTKQAEVDPTILFKDGVASVNVENIAKTQGKALTSGSISVFGGEKALLDGTVIEVLGGEKDGQVLVTKTKEIVVGKNADGTDKKETHKVTEWVDPKEFVSGTVTAKNGITVVNDKDGNSEFKLGGALTEPKTSITTTDKNVLAIEGLANVEKPVTAGNNLVIADKEGVLKQTSAKNLIEDAVEAGNLEAKTLKGVGITVTAGGVEGTDTSVASSLLKDVTLGIADKAITAGKLDAGTSTSDAPRVGIADKNGDVIYQDLETQVQNTQKTVVLENGTNTTVSSRVDVAKPNETIWKVDVANAVKTVTSATSLVAEDAIILVDANAATTDGIVITLPTASEENRGKKYTIKKLDKNEDGYVVIEGNVAGVESGKKLETGLPYSGWDLVSDGTQWQIVNKF
ncbi:hypothetical protein MODO_2165 [Myroides odoratimimus]|uniref:Uncharacterized protein n=1 Tax=Myroides odoratimimus CCUG 10230 TaxID=883150 RepID=A0ABN0E9M3_9FLAO|nr:hypothetical protein [Myroides odoratimimus]EHO09115.2 hypothetical protein HMPREF9712_01896 [Myroides odoratimimus CCUG 10230]MEC4086081.1 hypothetical protein [Myroides odoratimimus]GAQ14482.1 hypothetical protein MODO_2165 [Myroides odoratimimus]STZ49584.1 Uncharacterised protein [Myroides odoratimimus]